MLRFHCLGQRVCVTELGLRPSVAKAYMPPACNGRRHELIYLLNTK
jgi:hypothetical protein